MKLKELCLLLAKYPDQFNNLFGEFLDNFYRTTNEGRYDLLREEPIPHLSFERWVLPTLSATAHKLSNQYSLTEAGRYEWFKDKKYVLHDPYFTMEAKGDLRLYLLAFSPPEFKARNLFVEDNILSRV